MIVIMMKDEITSEYGRLFMGQIVDINDGLAKELVGRGIAVLPKPEPPAPEEPEKPVTEEPKHIGGGWYEMPDGEKVHGRKAAYGGKENK